MQRKIFFIFITLVLIGVLTTGIFALSLLRVNYINNVEDRLISNSKLIREFLYNTNNLKVEKLDNIAHTYSNRINARITFIDEDGWVVGDSSADLDKLSNHKDRPEIREAFYGKTGVSQRYSETLGHEMLYVAIPFDKENYKLSIIRLALPLKDITTFNRTLYKYILISILAGLLVALMLGYRYVKSVTDPIRELTKVTKKIASGNFDEKLYLKSDDELGELSESFNIMSSKLKKTIEELQDSNTKTKAILTSMLNGVIALDNMKRVILMNPTAEEIFGLKEGEAKGKYILETMRNNVLDNLVQKLLKDNVISKEEIEIFHPEHRVLNIYSNPIKLSSNPNRRVGVVIIIQDITEIRKLEGMRKDFVANVSHELKTPLTSIKGFVETLKDGAADNKEVRDKFLDIIDIEASRLTSLIQDLLLLSEIENKNSMINVEKIDTNKAIDEVIQVMNEIAKHKDIEIVNKINNNLPNLCGNKGWFKQMLINIIDNGVKYTSKGGTVTVTAYSIGGKLIIKTNDTGMGIEKEHLSRLFERFYRVDKARARQVGGTGLGLAIVKHIALVFRGSIEVKSEINKGTEFVITLPLEEVDL